jgi:hypothetical protein
MGKPDKPKKTFSNDTLDTAFEPVVVGTISHTTRCYESHPPLPLVNGLVLYGGSCITPVVTDADVYVGLDQGMKRTLRRFPWESGEEVFFPVPDGAAPADKASFVKLIDWLCNQLQAGRKCHVGCIGGHGRTGIVLSAVVKIMTGNEDAITYARENYCKKIIETQEQVKFLTTTFGITKAEPYHRPYVTSWSPKQSSGAQKGWDWDSYGGGASSSSTTGASYAAMRSKTCMWGTDALKAVLAK